MILTTQDTAQERGPVHYGPRSLTVLFDVSNKCNLRCRMCYFSYDSVFLRRAEHMQPAAFERIASSVLPMAHSVYLSAGSEPLTSPHFTDIVRIAARYAPPELKMLTNGLLLTAEIDEALIESGVTQVHVSIDGATRATYEHVRRGGSFDLLVRNLARLDARKRALGRTRPMLQFNVVLMRSNLDELERFVDLALELGVEQIACRHLMPYVGLDMESESTVHEPARANERFHAFLEHAARSGVRVTSFPDFYAIAGRPWTPPVPSAQTEMPSGASVSELERPFGHVDLPATSPFEAGAALEIAGWALDATGIAGVEIRRDAAADDAPAEVGADGRVHVGFATRRNGARPDVTALHPRVPQAYRAGWTFELARSSLPASARDAVRVHAIARSLRGTQTLLGSRHVLFRGAEGQAQPFLYCRKPFDNVYVDAAANVYPYPDCQTVDPFGSLAGTRSFQDVWFGAEFQELRRRIVDRDPPRMCLTCPDFINRRVDDMRFFEVRPVETDFRRPFGAIDTPRGLATAPGLRLQVAGWALGFSPVVRIEVLREARGGGELVLLGTAQPGEHARPDVAAQHTHVPGRERAGWSFELCQETLPDPGPVRIHVRATNAEGTVTDLGSVNVRFAPRIWGAIDRPHGEHVARAQRVDLVGWAIAHAPHVRVRAHVVTEDGAGATAIAEAVGHAKRRPDVAAHFTGIPGADRAGWRLAIDRDRLPPGERHVIEVRAGAEGLEPVVLGRRTLLFPEPLA